MRHRFDSGGPTDGLPFSRRERAGQSLQNVNDLAREAVGWNGLFGGMPMSTLL
jgi:hypothetical protein